MKLLLLAVVVVLALLQQLLAVSVLDQVLELLIVHWVLLVAVAVAVLTRSVFLLQVVAAITPQDLELMCQAVYMAKTAVQ